MARVVLMVLSDPKEARAIAALLEGQGIDAHPLDAEEGLLTAASRLEPDALLLDYALYLNKHREDVRRLIALSGPAKIVLLSRPQPLRQGGRGDAFRRP